MSEQTPALPGDAQASDEVEPTAEPGDSSLPVDDQDEVDPVSNAVEPFAPDDPEAV